MRVGLCSDSAETLLPVTLPHDGDRGESRDGGAFCSKYFSFFSLLHKHVKRRVLTYIRIYEFFWHCKLDVNVQKAMKLSAFNQRRGADLGKYGRLITKPIRLWYKSSQCRLTRNQHAQLALSSQLISWSPARLSEVPGYTAEYLTVAVQRK